jgi:ATP-dependent exoDNAse (exonuclease V) beta subunit
MTDAQALFFLDREKARPPQREAVTAPEPLVVVSAGAGTGKTRTLAWRFAWLVATAQAEFSEILTLTFTEKAALEMRQRIGATLKEWGEYCPQDAPEAKKRLLEGASRIEEARITTIHSYASSLVREAGFYLDIPPGGRVLSPPEESAFWNAFTRALDFLDAAWFRSFFPSGGVSGEFAGEEAGHFEELLAILQDSRGVEALNHFRPLEVSGWCKALGDLWKSRGKTVEDLKELMLSPERAWEDRLYRDFEARAFERWRTEGLTILDLLKELGPLEAKNNTAAKLRNFREAWPAVPEDDTVASFFLALLELFSGNAGNEKNWKAFSAAFQEKFGVSPVKWRDSREKEDKVLGELSCHPARRSSDGELRGILLRFGLLGWLCWEVYRGREGLFTFDDLIAWARRGVELHPSGGMGFRAVLVDEFQDTDPLQEALISRILEKNREDHPVSLFLVGDVKQSIYRFRHADPQIFASYVKKAREGGASGRYIQLDESFRSREALLNHINGFFGTLWKDGLGEMLPLPYEKLGAPKDSRGAYLLEEREKAPELPPVTHLFEEGAPGEHGKLLPVEERRQILARRLGELFLSFRGTLIWDKEQSCSRPCTFRDMAVLLPSRTGYVPLETALGELDIPVRLEKSQEYFSRGEILDAVAWLNALADPENNLALAGFLSSPFSPLSLEQVRHLLECLRFEKDISLAALLEREHPQAAVWMDLERRRAFFEGPRKALINLLNFPGGLRKLSPYLRKRGAVNLRLGAELAGEYEKAFGPDLLGCAAWLEQSTAGKPTRQEEAQPWGDEEDAVRIMTIHASKGLEFPLVALFGLEQSIWGNRSKSLEANLLFGAAPSSYPDPWEEEGKPPSRTVAARLEARATEEERQRLFYVGITRAQDALVFCGVPSKIGEAGELGFPSSSYLAWYLPWAFPEGVFGESPSSEEGQHSADSPEKPSPGEELSLPPFKEEGRALAMGKALELPTREQKGLAQLSATSYALLRYCPRAWRIRYRQGGELFWNVLGDFSAEPGGADLGSLVHWVLKGWNFQAWDLDRLLAPGGGEALPPGLPLEYRRIYREKAARERARKWLLALEGSRTGEELRRLAREGKLRRESSFRIDLPQGPRITGTLDAWAQEEGMLRIWDYKTGQFGGVPPEIYEEQLRFYAWGMHRIYPEHALSLKLLMLSSGEERSVSLPPSWEEMERDLIEAARQGEQGPFGGIPEKCPSCPWRQGLCGGVTAPESERASSPSDDAEGE